MKKCFGVIEIGSTNTKAYKYNDGYITELGFRTIEFKKNHAIHNCIVSSDLSVLVDFINDAFGKAVDVYVYATSLFRELSLAEIQKVECFLKQNTHTVLFEVVSAQRENELTVIGAIQNVSLNGNVCVFVGGGGSTEISICNGGEIVEMMNTKFGVSDVIKHFPDLAENYASTPLEEVSKYIDENLNLPTQKADYLILAGGDFLLRYNNARYPAEKNSRFVSQNHPLEITYIKNSEYESKYYHQLSLADLKMTTPENPNWWNGTRAMCAFTNSVARAICARIIFPTRISMIMGIVASLT